MFAKLILLSVEETSDLHATFAMADHPPAGRTCRPNPANTNGNGRPEHTQSHPPRHIHTHTHLLQPSGARVEDDVDHGGVYIHGYAILCARYFLFSATDEITQMIRTAARKLRSYLEIRPPSASMRSCRRSGSSLHRFSTSWFALMCWTMPLIRALNCSTVSVQGCLSCVTVSR